MAGEASEAGVTTGDIRSAILSELAAAPKEAPAEEAETAPTEDAEVEAEVEASADEPAEDESDDGAPVDEDAEPTSDDPKVQRGLDAVRVAEKRMRAEAARREEAFATKQREWQAHVEQATEIKNLATQMRIRGVVPVIRALAQHAGVELSGEDWVSFAQDAFVESPEGQKDPARKAHAQMSLKERERQAEIDAIRREHAETRKMLEQQQAEAKIAAQTSQYVQRFNASVVKFPLVAQYLKADPEDTAEKLGATFDRLESTLKREPTPVEVLTAYDKRERARLAKLGIDPAAIVKPKVVANGNKPAATKPANTNGTKPADKGNGDSDKDTILAELAQFKS